MKVHHDRRQNHYLTVLVNFDESLTQDDDVTQTQQPAAATSHCGMGAEGRPVLETLMEVATYSVVDWVVVD